MEKHFVRHIRVRTTTTTPPHTTPPPPPPPGFKQVCVAFLVASVLTLAVGPWLNVAMQAAAQAVPAAGESVASVPCCGMNGWQSRWPWPRVCLHHSAQRPEKARAREVEEQDKHEALRRQKAPPPGKWLGVLKDPEPQGSVGQHCGVGFELVQALAVLVLQMVDTAVLSFLRSSLPAVAEQVIEVPILSLPACAVQRVVPLEPQMAEQLVEVPTPFFAFEQNADIPVPHRCGGHRLQGYVRLC